MEERRFLVKRRNNFSTLNQLLGTQSNFTILPQPLSRNIDSSYYCMGILLNKELRPKRALIMDSMGANNVGTSIYYPQPVPRMSYYKERYGYRPEHYPNAENISDSMISLPVGPHLGLSEMETIARSLLSAIKDNS